VAGVTCLDWVDGDSGRINVADYDIIFVNCRSLTDVLRDPQEKSPEAFDVLKQSLASVRQGLSKVLKSRGRIYSIIDPLELTFDTKRRRASNHDWLPLPIELEPERGDTLTFADVDAGIMGQFRGYLGEVGHWTHVFSQEFVSHEVTEATGDMVRSLGKKFGGEWVPPRVSLQTLPIATDRQNNPIALICWYSVFAPVHVFSNRKEYGQQAAAESGPFALFVAPTQISCDEGIRMLMRGVLGIELTTLIPTWANDVCIPGDVELSLQVAEVEEELEVARSKLEGLLSKRVWNNFLKSIVWEKGGSLQEACRKVFEEIGIATRPSPVSDEFTIHFADRQALVEVSGSKKSISQRDVSQLQKDMASYFAKYGEGIKGVFVGNSWKDMPLHLRDTDENPLFPPNVKDWATGQKITLLSTVQLLEAFCACKRGEIDAGKVFEWMMTGQGEVNIGDTFTNVTAAIKSGGGAATNASQSSRRRRPS